jgi:hypothetical protein
VREFAAVTFQSARSTRTFRRQRQSRRSNFTTISLTTAERIADACEKSGAAEGLRISVMVLDWDLRRESVTGSSSSGMAELSVGEALRHLSGCVSDVARLVNARTAKEHF